MATTDNNSDDEYDEGPTNHAHGLFVLPPSDPTKEAFDQIIRDAKENRLILTDKKYREGFKSTYQRHFELRVQPENQTIFHLLANSVGHKGLAFWLIKNHPQLLYMPDDNGRTPLYITIVTKNLNVLSAILDKFSGNMDTLLALPCNQGRNSIHAAIFHSLPVRYTLELIQRASESTLCAEDQDGLTPLHLAVEYNRSSETQKQVVEALLKQGDKSLDSFNATPSKLSVYQYHQHTRQNTERHLMAVLDGSQASPQRASQPKPGELHGFRAAQQQGVIPDSMRGRGLEYRLISQMSLPQGRGATHEEPDPFPPSHTEPIQQQQLVATKQTTEVEWADKIIQAVKLHYLRSTFQTKDHPQPRDQSLALRFLHGSNIQDWNLYFDYSKAAPLVHGSSFKQSFAHMRLDSVLRYVAFGKIELQTTTSPRETTSKLLAKRQSQQPKPGRGRTDLVFLFKWLRDKSVKHILKVVVDDWPKTPHSDKAIEDCLKSFEVECLEWRKFDLCPETLLVACRDVQHLHLWWSGNRAILRAWSAPDGLARLEKLTTVHIVWNSSEVLESADRILSYIDDFKLRLQKAVFDFELEKERAKLLPQDDTGRFAVPPGFDVSRREIEVESIEERSHDGDSLTAGARATPMRIANQRNLCAHKWLNCMDAFADEIQNVTVPQTQHPLLQKDVTVALIDDGVSIDTPTIVGKVIGGATFDRGQPDENGPSPYFVSASGHGTVMADMICRVCPTAKLYVFKLETHLSHDPLADGPGQNQIVARSATQAIHAAVDRGVDIISISWTVKKPKDRERDADLKDLGDAMKRALDAGILIFCAAGDAGNFSDEEYPYEFDRSRIIRIGAATDDGRPWERSGDTHSLNFIFPGCSVVSRHSSSNSPIPNHFQENTGSSVATALAAGLAALVLHCVRLAAIMSENAKERVNGNGVGGEGVVAGPVEAARLNNLKDYRNMKLVFQKIGVDREIGKFVEVWEYFEGPTDALRSGGAAKAWETVTSLAVRFVSSMKS
ncbi:putative peptidase [Triangularia verruculosa]|uniref:Peptidase n=1 Tax=Triangularia verruculosa TaxID=2587418 RepID=A0AAN7AXW4_9PEZI|nr:putative peptidase [Triangularia verruculosa]